MTSCLRFPSNTQGAYGLFGLYERAELKDMCHPVQRSSKVLRQHSHSGRGGLACCFAIVVAGLPPSNMEMRS